MAFLAHLLLFHRKRTTVRLSVCFGVVLTITAAVILLNKRFTANGNYEARLLEQPKIAAESKINAAISTPAWFSKPSSMATKSTPATDKDSSNYDYEDLIEASDEQLGLPLGSRMADPQTTRAISILSNIGDKTFVKSRKFSNAAAMRYSGRDKRLHRLFMKLLFWKNGDTYLVGQQRKLRIAAVGGHFTVGQESYFAHFIEWLSNPIGSPAIEITSANTAIDGSISKDYFTLCLAEHLNLSKIDMIVVELASESDESKLTEDLVRSVWLQNSFIHIVLVHFPSSRQFAEYQKSRKCQSMDDSHYYKLAEHYQITLISWNHIFCIDSQSAVRQTNNNNNKTFPENSTETEKYFKNNGLTVLAHRQMAAFLVYYFRKSIGFLIVRLLTSLPVDATLIADRVSLQDDTRRLLYQQGPLFSANGAHVVASSSECFLSVDRPFKLNRRLRRALLINESSYFRFENDYISKIYDKGSEPIEDCLELFVLKSNDAASAVLSFNFDDFHNNNNDRSSSQEFCHQQENAAKTNISYGIQVAIIYYNHHQPITMSGELLISASFYLANNSSLNATFHVKLIHTSDESNKFVIDYLPTIQLAPSDDGDDDPLLWPKEFCKRGQSLIKSADVEIKLLKALTDTEFSLHAVVINYNCC